MKTLLSLTFAMTTSLGLLAGGLFAATHLSNGEPTHHFDHLGAPLWTSIPHRVDPANIGYQREAPDPQMIARGKASEVRLAELEREKSAEPDARTALASLPQASAGYNEAHLAYCRQRYRSYDPADNSYRPFSGGRQPCISPYMNDQVQSASADIVAQEDGAVLEMGDTGGAFMDSHVQWCSARYRSYDPASDSYRSFSGDIRRCISPY